MAHPNDRQQLIQDLAVYLNVSEEFVEARMNDANRAGEPGVPSVPNFWKFLYGHREGTPDEHKFFYAINPFYLFDLANFAGQFNPKTANAEKYMMGRCLDYGCGIGTVACHMSLYPQVDVVHAADVNILLLDFLRWRCEARGLDILVFSDQIDRIDPAQAVSIYANKWGHPSTAYDFIYARDVLEHCYNRVDVVRELTHALRPGGVLCEASPIFDYPEDIGKENIALKPYDLWDVLKDAGFELIEEEETGGFSQGTTKCWRKPE